MGRNGLCTKRLSMGRPKVAAASSNATGLDLSVLYNFLSKFLDSWRRRARSGSATETPRLLIGA